MTKSVLAVGAALLLAACGSPGQSQSSEGSSSSPSSSATASSPAAKVPSSYAVNQVLDASWKALPEAKRQDACATSRDNSGLLATALQKEFGNAISPSTWTTTFISRTCEAETKAADEAAAAKAEAAAAKALLKPSAYAKVSKRALAKIIRDPDAYVGKKYVVYAGVTQFDSATGTDTFRADVAHADIRDYGYWNDGENAMFTAGLADLSDVVQDDIVKMYVTVSGALSYDTQIGGSTTVPEFEVNIIKVIGQSK